MLVGTIRTKTLIFPPWPLTGSHFLFGYHSISGKEFKAGPRSIYMHLASKLGEFFSWMGFVVRQAHTKIATGVVLSRRSDRWVDCAPPTVVPSQQAYIPYGSMYARLYCTYHVSLGSRSRSFQGDWGNEIVDSLCAQIISAVALQ
jgi:hypothetical protein